MLLESTPAKYLISKKSNHLLLYYSIYFYLLTSHLLELNLSLFGFIKI